MNRLVSYKNNNNTPYLFPIPKQDKLRTFTPIILFHEHSYKDKNANPVECIINQNDEHHGEFIKSVKKRVDTMLLENSRNWLIISANSKEDEKRLLYGREQMMYHRQIPTPLQLANTIYSHHPQDQLDSLAMKPKRRRGNLPKATTALLKEWLAQHKKHPYPTEEEKLHLAKETKLSLQQISNWFINARRRHLPHLLESDLVGGKVTNSQTGPNHELDIYPYEASDNSAEDSDSNGLMRRHVPKCSARINKSGGIKKPYNRKRKMSSA
uniref:Homeobox protein AKR n=1 Tax=Anthurium amnicola TaxID=1678845 RepID=A0A1D1ZGV7_9ARAE